MALIEIISNKYVLNNKKKFNNNNIWVDNKRPENYTKNNDRYQTKNWIDSFLNYTKISFENFTWLKEIRKIYMLTNKISTNYNDEIKEFIQTLNDQYKNIFNNRKYHIRTDHHSLKSSKFGLIFYDNFYDIIISLITCSETHVGFLLKDQIINLYFIDWVQIDKFKEFRVFIKDYKIMAISQQYIYEPNKWFQHKSIPFMTEQMNKIIKYFDQNIKNKLMDISISDTSLDIAFVNDNLYMIELNPFGKEYSSGSALFNWIDDYDKLYTNNEINCRITL
jgi:hypothetical protein